MDGVNAPQRRSGAAKRGRPKQTRSALFGSSVPKRLHGLPVKCQKGSWASGEIGISAWASGEKGILAWASGEIVVPDLWITQGGSWASGETAWASGEKKG